MSDAGAIDEQVRALLRSRRPELERLVDQVLEAELATLVAERLAARNGVQHAVPAPEPTKACSGCGRDLALSRFEQGRSRCRDCRAGDATRSRERRQSPPMSGARNGAEPVRPREREPEAAAEPPQATA